MEHFDKEFCLEVWGPMACFTRPELKVERVSYDVITPSAARAIFEAIFWKPAIRWEITRIEVLNPIKWMNLRRNEVGAVASEKSSGIIIEDNITWALYSIFSDFKRPNIEQARQDYPNNTVIGLYHGTVVGATLNNGMVTENGVTGDLFEGCDFVLAGDLHKRQIIKRGDVRIVYPGSLIQQTFGETITEHGFAVWDVEKKSYKFIDLPIDYEMYDFEIKSPEDIDKNKEILLNY
jgi:CRISPR-associated Cas5-like protein